MSTRRQPPPKIVDDNLPSPPPARQPPPEPRVETRTKAEVAAVPDQPREPESIVDLATDGVDTAQVIAGLIKLRRRPVDPMTDYVPDGTRVPRFIHDAIAHEAALTKRKAQEVMRDALLGVRPLSTELLDAHKADLYGHEREPETR